MSKVWVVKLFVFSVLVISNAYAGNPIPKGYCNLPEGRTVPMVRVELNREYIWDIWWQADLGNGRSASVFFYPRYGMTSVDFTIHQDYQELARSSSFLAGNFHAGSRMEDADGESRFNELSLSALTSQGTIRCTYRIFGE